MTEPRKCSCRGAECCDICDAPRITVDRAAIIAHGVVFHAPRPARHGHLIRAMADLGVPTPINGTTNGGFLLSDGRFVRRELAKIMAWGAGQITLKRVNSPRVFCSEDLW